MAEFGYQPLVLSSEVNFLLIIQQFSLGWKECHSGSGYEKEGKIAKMRYYSSSVFPWISIVSLPLLTQGAL